jgi:hypothetical protein
MFNFTAYQVRSFRNYSLSYANMKNRFQWMAQAYAYTIFYYPSYAYYDPSLYYLLNYRDAMATREISGLTLTGVFPFSLYYRLETSVGYTYFNEDFYNPYINQITDPRVGGYNYFYNGNMVPFQLALVGETTRFKSYGPAKGNTFRFSMSQSLPFSRSFLQNTSVSLDYRQYLYLGGDTLFAFRFNGFMSRGKNPYVNYWGGNNEVRSAYFYSLIGTEGWYANLEFRIPLVNAAYTLLGPFGPVRGVAFLDVTRSKLGNNPSQFYFPVLGPDGEQSFILAEAQGSFGFGVEFFFLGMPMHVEFVKGLAWDTLASPFDWEVITGWRTKFWIGYDF